MKNKVVVTGIGVVSPIGNNIPEFTTNLKAGTSGIKYIPELKDYGFGCQVGGIPDITKDEIKDKLSAIRFENKDLHIQYATLGFLEALDNANLSLENKEDFTDTGIIIGTSGFSLNMLINEVAPLVQAKKVRHIRSRFVEEGMVNASAIAINKLIGNENMVTAVTNTCSTSGYSVNLGKHWIETGMANRMIVGGSDAYSPYVWALFDSIKAIDRKHNDTPESASRPMSESAKGFLPASGAGILILEDHEYAKRRNAPIFAEIAGGAINSGGQKDGGTISLPNITGIEKCITKAYNDANIHPEDIDLISGHLTGTIADPMEIKAWMNSGKYNRINIPYINAPKSLFGHCLGASGAIELIAAIVQMNENFIHPSLNCEDLHPEIARLIPEEKIPHKCIENKRIKYVAKASFGFGDVNSCLILKEH